MDRLTRDDLRTLVEPRPGPCLSIYRATARAGREKQQGPIALKNALRMAEEQLVAGGMRSPQARDFLRPLQALIDDGGFWREQGDGLAVFCAPGFFRRYRLPAAFDDCLFIGSRFAVTQLVPLRADEGRFFILAFSEEEVRLLEATKYGFRTVPLPAGLPRSMADALRYDVPDKQRRFHTITNAGSPGRGHPIYHGQGTGIDDDKDRLLRYFRSLDHGLHPLLRDETAPLVLAAAEYYFPIYREVNTYPHLVDEGIPGSPQLSSDQELHSRGWQIVEPIFDHERQRAKVQFHNLMGTGRAADDVPEIVLAAHDGRVHYLFVPRRGRVWGTFDPATRQVETHDSPRPGDEDLLDRAVYDTIRNSGAVYVVDPAEMPDDVPAAATFRY